MAESPSQSPMPARPNQSALWHGLGLFGESYLLFSIGTLRPVWEVLYPDCFSGEECRPWLTFKSLSYCVVLGVMVGMIVIGSIAGKVGRRSGSIITASKCTFVFLLHFSKMSTRSVATFSLFMRLVFFLDCRLLFHSHSRMLSNGCRYPIV